MTRHHDPVEEARILKRELRGLFEHIQRIRQEIASIRKPGAPEEEDRFLQMADELDAIVQATEQATDTIMNNVEAMDDIAAQLRTHVSDPDALAALDSFADRTASIFEACAFQDITGQRITKVVKTLQFIETRVNALISMWGAEEIAEADSINTEPRSEYEKYLHGPQLQGHGVSQADVDAMFGQPSAPAPKPTAAPAPTAPKPAPAKPAATKPAAAPAPKPAPAPAPKPAVEEDEGPKLGQDDIDKLFG